MRNVDGLLAIHRTAYYLKLPTSYHLDLTHDTESLIGIFSDQYADKFGWIICDTGTHLLNPNRYSPVNATFVERTFGGVDRPMFFFWWDGTKLVEVDAEKLDDLLTEEYALIQAISQYDDLIDSLNRISESYDIGDYL